MIKILKKYIYIESCLLILILFSNLTFSQSVENGVNLDTVKAQRFDIGKMWTFDFPPTEYFSEAYNFTPSKEWFDHVRMSALRFADYCSASFVSADGLIMTNHHCGRESVTGAEKPGEDLHKNGFFASTLGDERKIKDLYVEQLVKILDVTKEIQNAIESGTTNEEKVKNKKNIIKELEEKNSKETGLKCSVVSFYSGGQYSLYFYKRYSDIRLVFAPEDQAGFFGGDPDNFTYPRYDLDCTFFRVYDENGKPLKPEHFFKWSSMGASIDEPIFVVGNPASTNRLNTISQLEFKRDIEYPDGLLMLDFYYKIMSDYMKKNPLMEKMLSDQLFSISNSQKVYQGMIKGLNDKVLMARKKDFEKNFKEAVNKNTIFKEKYGNVWNEISNVREEMRKILPENSVYGINQNSSVYFILADTIVTLAKNGKKIDSDFIDYIYGNNMFGSSVLEYEVNNMISKLGNEHQVVKAFIGDRTSDDAVKYLLSISELANRDKAMNFIKKSPENILSSTDPFINFILQTKDKRKELSILQKELLQKETVANELLGKAIYDVFGTTIPPDATFTLRISDGVIKPYNYNGTIAPPKTTFYGIYDRYYSFNKEMPWVLPEIWKNPPKEFKLETPFNFISTCDISGGNSGSPVINKNAEIVGLAFDGNIESMPGDFIYTSETPTTVSVDSEGLREAIKNLYKAKRLSEELSSGKLAK